MRVFISFIVGAFLFVGCASKEKIKVEYQEVLVPTKCNAKMPLRPANDDSFEAHKRIVIYFLEVEEILKECVGEK